MKELVSLHRTLSSSTGTILLQLTIQLLGWTHWTLFMLLFANIGILYTPLVIGLFTIGQIRVRTCTAMLKRCLYTPTTTATTNPMSTLLTMIRVRLIQTQTLIFMLKSELILGNLLLVYLVGHMPVSGTLLTVVAGRPMPILVKAGLMLVVLGESTVIVVFHFLSASISKQLHSPYQMVMSVNRRVGRMHPVARIKMDNHIQAFTAKKRYGISYGGLGMVSYRTMVKVKFDLSLVMFSNVSSSSFGNSFSCSTVKF